MSHPAATGQFASTTRADPSAPPLPVRARRTRPGPRTLAVSYLLYPDDAAPGRARAVVREALTRWGLEELTGDAVQVISEIVSNAMAADARVAPHGAVPAPVLLHVTAGGGTLTMRVWDPDPAPPPGEQGPPADDDEHGRGLLIVKALSQQWGWTPAHGGKYVHATLTAPPGPGPGQPGEGPATAQAGAAS